MTCLDCGDLLLTLYWFYRREHLRHGHHVNPWRRSRRLWCASCAGGSSS